MLAWLESIAGSAYATAMLWTLGALLLLVVILLLIKVIRSLSFGTFVSGGRNRKTRLAVMDAAAVDSHRRLVLVRRDDVEHLILIGGPSDVVVEQNIRMVASLRRPVAEEPASPPARGDVRLPPDAQAMTPTAPAAAPAPEREEPAAPEPVERPRAAAPGAPVAPPARPIQPAAAAVRPIQPVTPAAPRPPVSPPAPVAARPAPAPTPLRPVVPPAPPPAPAPRPAPPKAVNDQPPSLDEALLEELEVTLDRNAAAAPNDKALPPSVEDEMEKLLGDLARPRR
jgi:hypothetical protein